MELFDWNILQGYAGAVLAVSALTQMTKDIPGIRRIPTQLWSYLLSVITLVLSAYFTQGFSLQGAALAFFNGALVSLSANGGYEALERIKKGLVNPN